MEGWQGFLFCLLILFCLCYKVDSVRCWTENNNSVKNKVLSVREAKLWYVSQIHQACIHTSIKVPSQDVESLDLRQLDIKITKDGVSHWLAQKFCYWADHGEVSYMKVDQNEVQIVACTHDLSPNITVSDQVLVGGWYDVKVKARKDDKWTWECHRYNNTWTKFYGEIKIPITNYCEKIKVKKYCPVRCENTCIDLITGQNRLFCDWKWVEYKDVEYLGTGSTNMDENYKSQLDPNLEKVRNGSLYFGKDKVVCLVGKTCDRESSAQQENTTDIFYFTHERSGGMRYLSDIVVAICLLFVVATFK